MCAFGNTILVCMSGHESVCGQWVCMSVCLCCVCRECVVCVVNVFECVGVGVCVCVCVCVCVSCALVAPCVLQYLT